MAWIGMSMMAPVSNLARVERLSHLTSDPPTRASGGGVSDGIRPAGAKAKVV